MKSKKGNNLYNTSWRLAEKTIKRQKLTKKKKQGKVVFVLKRAKCLKQDKNKYQKTC
ncbi:hypothetical protein IV47_GL001019 [Lactobacillus delbrueckii subsp. bulgaricus ATCC 11842 = JCM 1002]|nr:hypothetical protein IV47_GL001019 [Lactobacillus delbrueckii subsp. bulgaricus ATCC 11842 = JCM 1002]